jgi:hypothetical protein
VSGKFLVEHFRDNHRLISIDEVPMSALKMGGGRGKLDLVGKNLGAVEAGMLSELFQTATGLTTLCLSNNHLQSEGAMALATGLPRCVKGFGHRAGD